MHTRRSSAEQHPILCGLGILFGIAFVITYWPIFVAAGIAYGVYLGARAAVRCHRRRQCVHAVIAARADYEHAAIMRGRPGDDFPTVDDIDRVFLPPTGAASKAIPAAPGPGDLLTLRSKNVAVQ